MVSSLFTRFDLFFGVAILIGHWIVFADNIQSSPDSPY